MELSDSQLRQLLNAIERLHACPTLDAFPEHVLRELGGLVEHNLAGYNEVNVPLKRAVITFYPDDDAYQWMVKPFEKYMLQHPVLRFYEESGEGQAMAISDFITEKEFHALPIYGEMFEQVQAEDQIAIGMKLDDGVLLGIAFNRSTRGFAEEERKILNLVRPHVARAYLNLAKLEAAQAQAGFLVAALDESGLGVIEFDASGEVLRGSSEDALEDVKPYFRSEGAQSESSIPDGLRELIVGFALSDVASEKHQFEEAGEQITTHLRKRGDRVLLIASKAVTKNKAARKFGLTDRETEVGRWLCEGKTNQEIAQVLEIAPGTVKIHVQNILAKLGVENRTRAAVVLKGGS